ncbi:MAG TPA: hypothetical protein V6D19_15900 [Stenomitos sp.]
MTLWLHLRKDREMSTDSEDRTFLYRFAEDLDTLCHNLGVAKISSFFDSTDLELCLREDEEEDEEMDEDPQLDPETGYPYSIDDMNWFDVSTGLATFQALRVSIAGNALPHLDEDNKIALLEELDDCIVKLEGASKQTELFNLAIIM